MCSAFFDSVLCIQIPLILIKTTGYLIISWKIVLIPVWGILLILAIHTVVYFIISLEFGNKTFEKVIPFRIFGMTVLIFLMMSSLTIILIFTGYRFVKISPIWKSDKFLIFRNLFALILGYLTILILSIWKGKATLVLTIDYIYFFEIDQDIFNRDQQILQDQLKKQSEVTIKTVKFIHTKFLSKISDSMFEINRYPGNLT